MTETEEVYAELEQLDAQIAECEAKIEEQLSALEALGFNRAQIAECANNRPCGQTESGVVDVFIRHVWNEQYDGYQYFEIPGNTLLKNLLTVAGVGFDGRITVNGCPYSSDIRIDEIPSENNTIYVNVC